MDGKKIIVIGLIHIAAGNDRATLTSGQREKSANQRELTINELILWAGALILIIGVPVLLAREPQA